MAQLHSRLEAGIHLHRALPLGVLTALAACSRDLEARHWRGCLCSVATPLRKH